MRLAEILTQRAEPPTDDLVAWWGVICDRALNYDQRALGLLEQFRLWREANDQLPERYESAPRLTFEIDPVSVEIIGLAQELQPIVKGGMTTNQTGQTGQMSLNDLARLVQKKKA